ncbi:MAG TPA: hypothetical protein VGG00_07325, partial [Rhodanobacter sp.]
MTFSPEMVVWTVQERVLSDYHKRVKCYLNILHCRKEIGRAAARTARLFEVLDVKTATCRIGIWSEGSERVSPEPEGACLVNLSRCRRAWSLRPRQAAT